MVFKPVIDFYAKFSPKEKKFFIITLLVVLVACLDGFFFGPLSSRIVTMNEEIEQQKNNVGRDVRFLSYKEKIVKENEAVAKYFSEQLEEDDQVNGKFLSKLEKLASESNISLVKSNTGEVKKQKKYIEYSINMDCAGTLENTIKFMHAINTTDELLKIEKYNMTPKKGSTSEVTTSMAVIRLVMIPPQEQ